MARTALEWTREKLSQETKANGSSGISARTIAKFEDGEGVAPETVEALRACLVRHGIEFINGGKRAGVAYQRKD